MRAVYVPLRRKRVDLGDLMALAAHYTRGLHKIVERHEAGGREFATCALPGQPSVINGGDVGLSDERWFEVAVVRLDRKRAVEVATRSQDAVTNAVAREFAEQLAVKFNSNVVEA